MPASQATSNNGKAQRPGNPRGADRAQGQTMPGFPLNANVMAKPTQDERLPGYPLGCNIM